MDLVQKERTIIKSILLIQYMLINNIFRNQKLLWELLDLLLQKNKYVLSLAGIFSPKIHNWKPRSMEIYYVPNITVIELKKENIIRKKSVVTQCLTFLLCNEYRNKITNLLLVTFKVTWDTDQLTHSQPTICAGAASLSSNNYRSNIYIFKFPKSKTGHCHAPATI